MNKFDRDKNSLNYGKQLNQKNNIQFKLNNQNQFSHFTGTVMMLTLLIKIVSPVQLAFSQPLVDNSWKKQTHEAFILAQEEAEVEAESPEAEREAEAEAESPEAERESEAEAESPEAERESEAETESPEAERESEAEAESPEAEREAEVEAESPEAEREAEVEAESPEAERETESESEREEESEAEGEFSLEEGKEALEEKIDEYYEEWKSNKTSVQISHSFTAITTIVMTIVITLIGTGLFVIPSGRLVVMILGIITVLLQLNSNIFLLGKNLGGYKILEEQGLIIKEKLETVKTKEELIELNELFNELVLDSLSLE